MTTLRNFLPLDLPAFNGDDTLFQEGLVSNVAFRHRIHSHRIRYRMLPDSGEILLDSSTNIVCSYFSSLLPIFDLAEFTRGFFDDEQWVVFHNG